MNKPASYIMTRADGMEEKGRLDLQHQIWLLSLDGTLHKTQLPRDLTSILDVGTGTGSWAVAMARAWPNAEVVATDLTLPQVADIPLNLTFQFHDANREWPFKAEHFDFIFGRMLTSGIHDWPEFLSKCWTHLAPGGRLELLDICHPFRADLAAADTAEASPFIRFGQLAQASWAQSSIDYIATTKHAARLKGLGFVDIEEHVHRWPLGQWAETERERHIGALALDNFTRFIGAAGKSILTHHNFVADQAAEDIVEAAMRDLHENCNSKRLYLTMKIHTALKPALGNPSH